MDRLPTSAELAYWTGILNAKSQTLDQCIATLAANDPFTSILNLYFPGWQAESARRQMANVKGQRSKAIGQASDVKRPMSNVMGQTSKAIGQMTKGKGQRSKVMPISRNLINNRPTQKRKL
jgi:hypothetical protein